MDKMKFPDLNKDGKITKADILKGRGVAMMYGGKTKHKKMQSGGVATPVSKPKIRMPVKKPTAAERDNALNKAKIEKLRKLRSVTQNPPMPRPKKYGGATKPYGMKHGGKCRGMGAATRGGKYKAT